MVMHRTPNVLVWENWPRREILNMDGMRMAFWYDIENGRSQK
jgi:hypothetical protein